MPLAGRQCDIALSHRAADAAAPADAPVSIDIVLSAGARVARYDYRHDRPFLEELVVDAARDRKSVV